MLRDLAEAISITTFRVWKNNIGKGGIKDFFKVGEAKKQGDYLKSRGINTLCKLMCNMLHDFTWTEKYEEAMSDEHPHTVNYLSVCALNLMIF